MRKELIYDLPTRIFHWLFSGLFVVSFFIAETVDDEDHVFTYHMMAGLLLGALVLLRILWGLIGTRYARFSSFALHPLQLLDYVKAIFSGDKKRWAGHNPASSWAALTMLFSGLILAISGILMTSGYKKEFEDLHELFANIFLITALLHIAGVLLHSFKYQDAIGLSMIHGKKEVSENNLVKISAAPISAIILILLMTLFSSYLYKEYNPTRNEINLFGKTLILSEND